jgi:hypothetical protein
MKDEMLYDDDVNEERIAYDLRTEFLSVQCDISFHALFVPDCHFLHECVKIQSLVTTQSRPSHFPLHVLKTLSMRQRGLRPLSL